MQRAAVLLGVILVLAACGDGSSSEGNHSESNTVPSSAVAVTEDFLFNAPIESECELPAGNLVEGTLPLEEGATGGASIATVGESESPIALVGDFSGDGVDDGVLPLSCSAGGPSWPQILYFYSNGELAGRQNLSDLSKGSRELVTDLVITDGQVRARWTKAINGEPECCGLLPFSANFTAEEGKIKVTDLRAHYDRWASSSLLEWIHFGMFDSSGFAPRPPPLRSEEIIGDIQQWENTHGVIEHTNAECSDRRAAPAAAPELPEGSRWCQVADGAFIIVSSMDQDTEVLAFMSEL